MPFLHCTNTLLYYDGPQVILADGEEGECDYKYFCVLIEQGQDADRYLCARMKPFETWVLPALLNGAIDVLSVFQYADGVLMATAYCDDISSMFADNLSLAEVDPAWLPDAGLFLDSGTSKLVFGSKVVKNV